MIDPKTFKVDNELQIPGECYMLSIILCPSCCITVDDSLGSQSLFITGEKLGQIRATKEVCCVCVYVRMWCVYVHVWCVFKMLGVSMQGGFLIREFTTLASPLVAVEEKPLNLAQRNLLCMGKAKYDQQEHLHTLCK